MITVPTAIAREAGFLTPVQISPAAWDRCVEWTPEATRITGIPQDREGRLWDVLWMTRRVVGAHPARAGRTPVALHCWSPTDRMQIVDDEELGPPLVDLVAHCGFDPRGEPLITITMPGEQP